MCRAQFALESKLLPHSFQGVFFLENHQKPLGNGWVLKRTMAEKIGESTPRKLGCLSPALAQSRFSAGKLDKFSGVVMQTNYAALFPDVWAMRRANTCSMHRPSALATQLLTSGKRRCRSQNAPSSDMQFVWRNFGVNACVCVRVCSSANAKSHSPLALVEYEPITALGALPGRVVFHSGDNTFIIRIK